MAELPLTIDELRSEVRRAIAGGIRRPCVWMREGAVERLSIDDARERMEREGGDGGRMMLLELSGLNPDTLLVVETREQYRLWPIRENRPLLIIGGRLCGSITVHR